jgi:hypothetical protein
MRAHDYILARPAAEAREFWVGSWVLLCFEVQGRDFLDPGVAQPEG